MGAIAAKPTNGRDQRENYQGIETLLRPENPTLRSPKARPPRLAVHRLGTEQDARIRGSIQRAQEAPRQQQLAQQAAVAAAGPAPPPQPVPAGVEGAGVPATQTKKQPRPRAAAAGASLPAAPAPRRPRPQTPPKQREGSGGARSAQKAAASASAVASLAPPAKRAQAPRGPLAAVLAAMVGPPAAVAAGPSYTSQQQAQHERARAAAKEGGRQRVPAVQDRTKSGTYGSADRSDRGDRGCHQARPRGGSHAHASTHCQLGAPDGPLHASAAMASAGRQFISPSKVPALAQDEAPAHKFGGSGGGAVVKQPCATPEQESDGPHADGSDTVKGMLGSLQAMLPVGLGGRVPTAQRPSHVLPRIGIGKACKATTPEPTTPNTPEPIY
jgi:hypothetical protein